MHGKSHVDSHPELAYKLMQFSEPVMGKGIHQLSERESHYPHINLHHQSYQ